MVSPGSVITAYAAVLAMVVLVGRHSTWRTPNSFRTIAVKEAIGDRVPGAVAWNLFDIDAKFGDVHTVDECVAYLNSVGSFAEAAE